MSPAARMAVLPDRPPGAACFEFGARIFLALLLAFDVSLMAGCAREPEPQYLRIRGPAPQIADRPATSGVLVVFWAAWCEPCREEAPSLAALAQDPPEGLSIVVFSHDETIELARESFGVSGPRLRIRLDSDRKVANAFGVDVLPAAILVAGPSLAARFDGRKNWNSAGMRRILERLARPATEEAG